MDLATLQWHEPFVRLFKMRPEMLPRIASNVEVYGHVSTGPLQGVPISGSLGDQMAAMLGLLSAPALTYHHSPTTVCQSQRCSHQRTSPPAHCCRY
jgi:glycerol kinase